MHVFTLNFHRLTTLLNIRRILSNGNFAPTHNHFSEIYIKKLRLVNAIVKAIKSHYFS